MLLEQATANGLNQSTQAETLIRERDKRDKK